MAFDGITIANIVSELRQTLTGGRIYKIAQPENDELLLTVKNNGSQYRLLLSADAFHQETIPLETVLYFGKCVTGEGIPVKLNPAWLVSREHDNPYNIQTREIMKAFADMQIPAAVGNIIFPAGNARKYLGEYFKDGAEYENPYDEDPADLHTISFKPDGSALGGNINRDHILDIIAAYRP